MSLFSPDRFKRSSNCYTSVYSGFFRIHMAGHGLFFRKSNGLRPVSKSGFAKGACRKSSFARKAYFRRQICLYVLWPFDWAEK